jgi:hypothetical protein
MLISDLDVNKLMSSNWPFKMSNVVCLVELDLTFLRHVHFWCFFIAKVLNCLKISQLGEFANITNE